jgi:hypothetical protein
MCHVGSTPPQSVGAKISALHHNSRHLLLQMFQHKAFATAGIEQAIYAGLPDKCDNPFVKSVQQSPL